MKLWFIQAPAVLVVLLLQLLPATSQVKGFSTVTSTKADQYGLLQVTIRNNSKRNIITAYIAHSCSGAGRDGTEVSAVGFEPILFVPVGSGPQDPGIAPSGARTFEFKAAGASCPETISVIFSDGHCEGATDGAFGCTQLLADRRAAYEELARIRSFVQKFSDQDPEYISKLAADLESRRVELSQYRHSDNPQQGMKGRKQVIESLKTKFPPYTLPPPELSTPTHTVDAIDVWMKFLAAGIPLPQDSAN
jgi:hypothetical protein